MRGPEREFLGPEVIKAIERIEQEAADLDRVIGFNPVKEIAPLNPQITEQLKSLRD